MIQETGSSGFPAGSRARLQGCQRYNQQLTLYRLSGSNEPVALGDHYRHIPCGHRPLTAGMQLAGILLCAACADKLGFLVLA